MAHHKRRRPKHSRAGCLFCKPHKSNKSKDREEAQTQQERKARISEKEQINDSLHN
jgi:radical SAM superfamily enzyme